jgi:hypothetical protein
MAAVIFGIFLVAAPSRAQFTLGVGGGGGVGTRGGSESALHGIAFAEFKTPVLPLPGLRGDVMLIDPPSGSGPLSLSLNVVLSLPIPVVKPYVLGGWGSYGIGKGESASGWNVGVGVRVALGVGVFAEARRHDKIGRDLLTVGITF